MHIFEVSKPQAFLATAIISLMATIALVLNFDGTWMHPDTAQALSVARNLQAGNGFATGIIYYEEHYCLNSWPAPQTVFPIGYPALLAALGWTGMSLRSATAVIGVTGFFLVPFAIFTATVRMGRRPLTAVILAAQWLCFPMLWHNVWERQTEMMFISLTLSSLILLQGKSTGYRELLLAGFLAAIAMTLRYAGIFWILAAGLAFLTQIPQYRFAAIRRGCAFLLIPVTVAVTLFTRNLILIGDLKGGSTKDVNRTLSLAAENAYYAASRLTGLDKTNLVSGQVVEVAVASGIALIMIAAVIGLLRQLIWNKGKLLITPQPGNSVVYFYIFVSLAALISLEKTTSINLSPRMLFPLIPFVLMAVADIISRSRSAFSERTWQSRLIRSTVFAGAVFLTLGTLSGQFRAADEVRGYVHRFGMVSDIISQPLDTTRNQTTAMELIQRKRILSDEPEMLGEAMQQGVVGLTSTNYSNRIWTDDEVKSLIRKYHINCVVVFPAIQPKDENPFFESLMRQQNVDGHSRAWLDPVVVSPHIHIYTVRDSLLLTQHN